MPTHISYFFVKFNLRMPIQVIQPVIRHCPIQTPRSFSVLHYRNTNRGKNVIEKIKRPAQPINVGFNYVTTRADPIQAPK